MQLLLVRKIKIIIIYKNNKFCFLFAAQATNLSNDEVDISALDAFCQLLKNEPDLSVHATRILAAKIQSPNVKEALFSLDALEGKLLMIS